MTIPTEPPADDDSLSSEPIPVATLVEEPPSGARGHTIIAWLVIAAITTLIVIGMQLRPAPKVEADAGDEAKQESTVDNLMQISSEVQGKVAVAFSELMRSSDPGVGNTRAQLYRDLEKSLNQGPAAARLRFVVLAGDLDGPREALDKLAQLRTSLAKNDREFTADEARQADLLEQLYRGYLQDPGEPPQLGPQQRDQLRSGLGWLGRLALAPPDGPDAAARQSLVREAASTVAIGAALMVVMSIVACVGFVILITLFVLAVSGKLRSMIVPSTVHPGIYAETFACWMVLFTVLNILIVALAPVEMRLMAVLAAQMLSLALALGWPLLRGVRFSDVRRDVGLTLPRHAWLEPLRGLATYALALPILAVGLLVMVILLQAQAVFVGKQDPFARPDVPSHPIVEMVRQDNPWIFVQLLLVAAVGAPIVEEIMFRGVLYRSLRDSSRGLRAAASIFVSIAVSGFLFAVIHPQGWLGIPVLGALASGFAIAREWRGTIWPPIFAHAINNGLVTLLLFALVG